MLFALGKPYQSDSKLQCSETRFNVFKTNTALIDVLT